MKALLMIPATCRKYCYGKHASRCMLLLSTICIVFLAYVDAFRVSLAGRMLKRYCYQTRYSSVRLQLSMSTLPKDVAIDLSNIQLTRLIGTLDMTVDQQVIEESRQDYQRTSPQSMPVFDDLLDQCRQQDNRANIIRTFEARLKSSGNRVFIKEFLPLGLSFGRRELATIRGLSVKWNDICGMRNLVLTSNANYSNNNLDPQFSQDEQEVMMKQVNSWRLYRSPPFPTLLGTVRLPVEVVSPEYKEGWKQNVLRMNFNPTRAKLFAPPSPGSVWLIYSWDASSFQTLRRFPALPQVIEGLDYFNPTARNDKKWIFIRKIIAEALLAVDFLHRNGMVHNGINSNTMWLSTNTQQDYKKLTIFLSDLSLVQQNQEIGPQLLKDGIQEDLYQLGFVFLELVFASYVEDNNAASEARKRLQGELVTKKFFFSLDSGDQSQLSQKEWRRIFEEVCDSDFPTLLAFCRTIKTWKIAMDYLENDEGAAWKLIFTMLTRGRLVDNENDRKKLSTTARSLLRQFRKPLFNDVIDA